MSATFDGTEIIEFGIQIEKNGRDFYNILSEQSDNIKNKKIFSYLSKQEEGHIVVFQEILKSVSKYEPVEAYPEEYFSYLRILAGEYVFTQKNKGSEIAKKIKNDKEAIDMAMGFEKDSILFFEGMKKLIPEHDQKIIDNLISQEQNHLKQLYDIKNII